MSDLINRILDEFKDINYAYNDSTRLDTLSYMLDELVEQAAPRWVRCEEEVPKNVANRVLVYCENGVTYVAHYEGGETDMWYANAGTWWEELTGHRKVTHWMPIEPPKEDA